MNETLNPQETTPQPVINQAPPPQATQAETTPVSITEKKEKPVLPTILSILLFLALGAAGYFAYIYYQPQTPGFVSTETTIKPTAPPTPLPTPKPTANWNTYTNSTFSFSFNYPDTWTVQDTGLKTISNIQDIECEIGKIELTNTSQNLIVYMYYRSSNTCNYQALRTGVAYNPISEEKKLTISNSEVIYQYYGDGYIADPPIGEIMYNNSTFVAVSDIEFLFGTLSIESDLNFTISENTAEEINDILESISLN